MTRIDDRAAPKTPVDAPDEPAPATPSADVVDRATRIQDLLGGLSVPFSASDIPDGLIRAPERRDIEVRRREQPRSRSEGPTLDPRSFDVMNRMVVANTHYLKRELGRRFEFVGAVADAVRTPSGRWYFQVKDPTGQKMDVLFGDGVKAAAKFMMHQHAGRQGYSDELSPEATLELAKLVSTARLRPAPKKQVSEFVVDDEEELPEDREELAKEEYRAEDHAAAKQYLKEMVDRTPKRLPPLLRELARKEAADLAEADLDRLIGTIAGKPIMLRAFELDTYDGNTLRLARTDAAGNVSLIELMIQEFEDREPGAMLRVAIPPEDPPAREFDPDLAKNLQIMDDVDDDLLTPTFEVTSSSLGLALFRFATDKLAYPPVEVDQHDELLKFVDPKREHIVADEIDPEDLDDDERAALEKPFTTAETRKFRQALKWLDANWDGLISTGLFNNNGIQTGYLTYYGDNANQEFAKLKQVCGLLASDKRFVMAMSQPSYINREVIQTTLEKLENQAEAA